MPETVTSGELARELADTYDVGEDSARRGVEAYLDQLEQVDDSAIDHDEISEEHADAVREAYAAFMASSYVSALDELAEVRDRLDALAELQDERARLIRKALADGARIVDIVEASGLTRARIYQIRDGR